MPNNNMGKGDAGVDADGKAITNKTFEAAARAFGTTLEQTKREIYEMLRDEFEGKRPHSHQGQN